MNKYIAQARGYVSNPANRQVVSVATGVAAGIIIAPIMVHAFGATAMGVAGKVAIGCAVGAGTGVVTHKVVDRAYDKRRVAVALLLSNN